MTTSDQMTRAYNNAMVRHPTKYYEGSGYFNFGYWGAGAKSHCDPDTP